MSSKATPENKPTAETSSSEPSAPPTPSGGGQNNQHQNGNTYTAPYGSSNRRKKRKKKRPGQQQQQQGGGMQRGNSGIPANVLPNEEDLRAEAAELDKIAGTKDYEKAAKDALNIADLQTMPLDELHELAEQQKIEEPSRKPRPELIFEILKAKAAGGDLMFGGGTLEVMAEGFGFLRQAEASYVASPDDIYVAPTIIRNMGLRQGMEIKGAIRPPKEGERFFALLRIDEVNKGEPARVKSLPVFEDLTPLHPEERFVLETEQEIIETRVVDLVAPIGKGQRALIVAPPRTGKTVLMQKITKAIHKNYPDVKIIVLLIDERPEEVTDFRRNTGEGVEVVASTFDEDAKRHIQVAEMVMSKARRYVEFGEDVVILLDSITRLARAYNAGSANTGKIMSGGIDSGALTRPKKFFGSARAIENGGSLTILGTALVDTGSKADEVIFEEFKGTGNSELHLDRKLIEKRIFPAIDVTASGTRREELLLDPKELELVYRLRKVLSDMNVVEAMELLKSRLSKSKTNAEFLITMNLG
ncbi:MAG: transcription termination factor Rho [Planctomycetota bacterium]